MSADERFIELWSDYLEGELDETGTTELRRLLAQDDRLVQMAADSYRTHRLLGLMAQDSESQQDDFVQQTLNRLPAEDGRFVGAVMRQILPGSTAAARPRTRSLDTWRWIMRSPVSRVSAAAVFVLAITGVALWFHGGGATFAFADFVAPILEAKSAKFKVTTEMKGPPAVTTTGEVMVLDATRMRQEMETEMEMEMVKEIADLSKTQEPSESKMVMIFDWGRGKILTLDPVTKKAVVVSHANLTKEQVAQQDMFASFRSILLDARDKPEVKREPLGEKDIDGRRVVGFRVSSRGMVVSLWGDPKTGLPVRAETTMAIFPNAKTTMSDFEFNVEMDESLFSVEPPAGYTVQNMKVDASPAQEKDLIETFRLYSQLSDGPFPDSLDMQPMMQAATKMVGMKEYGNLMHKIMDFAFAAGKEKPSEEEMREMMQAEVRETTEAGMQKMFMEVQIRLQRGLFFVFELPPEADAHYAGKGVSLGAADTPIFWYCPKDAKKYRAIYADLSVREVETPPEVPDAQPVPAQSSPKE